MKNSTRSQKSEKNLLFTKRVRAPLAVVGARVFDALPIELDVHLHGERGGRADAAHGEKDEDLHSGLWLFVVVVGGGIVVVVVVTRRMTRGDR